MNKRDATDYFANSTEYEILYSLRDLICLYITLFEEDYCREPVMLAQTLEEIEQKLRRLEENMPPNDVSSPTTL